MLTNLKKAVLVATCFPVCGGICWGQNTKNEVLSNAKEVNSETKWVTVYLQGVKEKRTASVSLSAGEQQLLFTDLPQHLNPNTLRLGASDFVQIVSINHRHNYVSFNPDEDPEIRQVKDSMDNYVSQVKLKEGVYNSLQGTRQMILANKTVKGETHGMEAEDVADLLDYYREKLNEINIKSLEIERQLEKLREHRDRFTREYNQVSKGKNKTYSELLVTVKSAQAGKANFTIEFFAPVAGWVPQYDIRNNGSSGQLEITSYANIWQMTGYKWKNVDITLSTLDPQFDIEAPDMQSQVLELNPYVYKTPVSGYYNGNDRMREFLSDSLRGGRTNTDKYFLDGYRMPNTSSEKGPGTEYKIATPYTIESANKETKIEINRKQVMAAFKYKTVPKVEKAVFLMAVVTGWDTLNYYPGNANVFNNGTFVGSVFLNTNSVEDSLQLSLGQDKSFSVEYEVLNEKTFTTSSGSSVKRGKGFTIKILNKKDIPVTIEIVDQVPISTNTEASVAVDKTDGTTDPLTGIITWRKTITPGQKLEVPLSYTVKYPNDHVLHNF